MDQSCFIKSKTQNSDIRETQTVTLERLSMTFTSNGREDHVTFFPAVFDTRRLNAKRRGFTLMKNVSKICLFLCCCDVLTTVCFKAKLRYFLL